jgi:aspartokinase
MNKINNIAENILNKLNTNNQYGSVISILMIVSIILTSVRILQECKKNNQEFTSINKNLAYQKEVKLLSQKRGWWTKLRLKKIIRKELPYSVYKECSNQLVDIMLNYGENITEEETQTLLEAANV